MNLSFIDLIVVFFVSGLGNLIAAYFNEKGKNIATQEDIGKITTTVESIKSDLQVALQNTLNFIDDQKQSLMGYFLSYHTLVEDSLNIRTEFLSNTEKFVEMRNRITDSEINLNIAEAKIEIYAFDENLILVIGELKKMTIEFSGKVSMILIALEGYQSQIDILKKNPDYYTVKAQIDNYYDQRNNKYDEYCHIKVEYYKSRQELYMKLRKLLQEKLINRT